MFFKNMEIQHSEQELLMRQFMDAKLNLKIAEANFNNCDPDFFDIVNSELTIAWQRLRTILQRLRKMNGISENFDSPS